MPALAGERTFSHIETRRMRGIECGGFGAVLAGRIGAIWDGERTTI